MLLTKAQNLIAEDQHRFRVVCVGRRGGKTTLAIEEIKGKALAKPSKIAYIANTYQQARDIAWETLKKELLPIITNINESRLEIKVQTIKGGESLIILRGWESIETLRGQAFGFIVIDEVAMMRNFWLNWQEVISPTLADNKGEVLFISTPKGFNHFYDLYNLENKDKDFKSFHFTTYDNEHIPKEEIERQKEILTNDAFAQEFLADFRKATGLVYKEFMRSRHTYDIATIKSVEKIGGIDFGYTNPASILTVVKDYDAHYWITDEWYHRGKTDNDIAEVAQSLDFNKVYPDPENAGGIEELKRRNINVCEVIKGKGSVTAGIQKIRELFKQNRIHIHKDCVNLLWELETYHYPDKKGEKNEEENPVKENDHALDALRYIISMNDYRDNDTEKVSSYTPNFREFRKVAY